MGDTSDGCEYSDCSYVHLAQLAQNLQQQDLLQQKGLVNQHPQNASQLLPCTT